MCCGFSDTVFCGDRAPINSSSTRSACPPVLFVVLVAAKSDAAHHGLSEQFRDHSIDRVYRAFVRGLPGADQGRVARPIGRHPRDREGLHTGAGQGRRDGLHHGPDDDGDGLAAGDADRHR